MSHSCHLLQRRGDSYVVYLSLLLLCINSLIDEYRYRKNGDSHKQDANHEAYAKVLVESRNMLDPFDHIRN